MKNIYTLILSVIISAVGAFAQSVETAGFEPDTVRPDGVAEYRLVFKDLKGSVDISKIRLPDGLSIVGKSTSRNYSFVNGKMSNSTTLVLSMRASKEGQLTIPEWEVSVDGKPFKIAAATLSVDKSAPVQTRDEFDDDPFGIAFGNLPISMRVRLGMRVRRNNANSVRQQIQSFESNLRNNAKLEIKFPRQKIYVGESVPCELVFSFDNSLTERGFTLAQLMPEIKKADAFDCPAFSEKPAVVLSPDGKRVLVKYTTAITPLKAGSYDLDFSAKGVFNRQPTADDLMGTSIFDRMMSFGGGTQIPFEVNMESKKVEVAELPAEGRPADFTGAIGSFSLENVRVEPDALTVGEPCSIFAKIVGVGNFPRIREPKLEAGDDWKTYKAKSSFTDESNGLANIGFKTFEYTAVPKKADLPFAPAVLFNYFDPISEKYVEIKSKPAAVSVAPSGRSKRAERERNAVPEPAFGKIVETASVSDGGGKLLNSPYFWGGQVLFVCVLAAFVLARRESLRRKNDAGYAKSLSDKKESARHLKSAREAAKNGDFRAFFEQSRRALQYALAAECDRQAPSLTTREALEMMSERGMSDSDKSDATLFFDGADAISFGGMDTSKLDIHWLDGKLVSLVGKISKRK